MENSNIQFNKRVMMESSNIQFNKHETEVQAFYSTGAKARSTQGDGFLSFGYWEKNTESYLEACEHLLNRIIHQIKIPENASILNVSCGFGAETLRIHDHFKPESIIGLDLTSAHIEYAQKRANHIKNIQFVQGNACELNYADNSFDLIIGVEGPAHYNTREKFLKEAYRVLKPNGRLLLSDIVLGQKFPEKSTIQNFLSELTAKTWHMPKANQINLQQYKEQLSLLGFRVDRQESIGNKVFDGFARSNLKIREIFTTMKTRGVLPGIGLTFISWLLAYVYKKGYSDYIIISAVK